MFEFIDAVGRSPFLAYALLAGILISVVCGVVGTFVVTRRITYIAGSIAHFILGGMGAARYVAVVHGVTWLRPMHGAVVAALLAACIISLVRRYSREREDTLIGALWAIGMAVGVLFIARTPGYNEDLQSYLFGNILMVPPADLWLILVLDVVVLAVAILFYRPLIAVCFDQEFARLRGIPVDAFYFVLLCLTALTVVLLVTVVGVVMVIALLTLPVSVAGQFSRRMWHMMVLSALLISVLTTCGLALSYQPDLPPGATIVCLSGVVYAAAAAGRAIAGRFRTSRMR